MAKLVIIFLTFGFWDSVAYASDFRAGTSYVLSALFSLALVILIIFIALKALKYFNKLTLDANRSDNIQLIESFSISQVTRIHIIKIAGKVFSIIENQGGMEVISEINQEDLVENNTDSNNFKSLLDTSIKKLKKKSDEDET